MNPSQEEIRRVVERLLRRQRPALDAIRRPIQAIVTDHVMGADPTLRRVTHHDGVSWITAEQRRIPPHRTVFRYSAELWDRLTELAAEEQRLLARWREIVEQFPTLAREEVPPREE